MQEHEMEIEKLSGFVESNWNIKPQNISFIKEGDSTNNWKVVSENGQAYILRNGGNYEHYVRFQCDVLNFLAERDFPYQIPIPIRTKQGDFVIYSEGGNYLLYRFVLGKVLEEVSPEDAVEIGRMLAVYHEYVADFDWQDYRQLRSKDLFDKEKMIRFVAECKKAVGRKPNKTNLDVAYLPEVDGFVYFYLDIVGQVDFGFYESLPKIPCHGDFERKNIVKKGDRLVGFIDLGGITIDPQVCDLQSCIQLNSIRDGKLDRDLMKAIAKGYTSHARLEGKHLVLILPLIYSEMLKTLCWVMYERSSPGSRVKDIEASERIKIMSWMINSYSSLEHFLNL